MLPSFSLASWGGKPAPKKSAGGKEGSIFPTLVRAPCCQIRGLALALLIRGPEKSVYYYVNMQIKGLMGLPRTEQLSQLRAVLNMSPFASAALLFTLLAVSLISYCLVVCIYISHVRISFNKKIC